MFKYIYMDPKALFGHPKSIPIITLLQENKKQALVFPIINIFDQLKDAIFADVALANMPLVFDLY